MISWKLQLPTDAQKLWCVQEELEIKKRMLEQMMDKRYMYAANKEKMTQTIEKWPVL